MAHRVLIPTPLRPYTGQQDVVELDGGTVGEVLKSLTSRYGDLRRHLYSDDGKLRSFVNVYVNDEDIRYLDREATALKQGDVISIVPSVAGGAPVSTEQAAPELTADEFQRYSRHLILPEVGVDGQRRLKGARVLCVGAGGLDSPAALYLAGGLSRWPPLLYPLSSIAVMGVPLLLGFVLGPLMEEHFRRAMLISRGSFQVFIDRPLSLAFLLATVALPAAADTGVASTRGGVPALQRPNIPVLTSENIDYVGYLPLDVPAPSGRYLEVDGERLFYVWGMKGLSIYNVDQPEWPLLIGHLPLPASQNEDVQVSADGSRVLVAADGGSSTPVPGTTGLHVIDTADPRNPEWVAWFRAGINHTVHCADDTCEWVYGNRGDIYRIPLDLTSEDDVDRLIGVAQDPPDGADHAGAVVVGEERQVVGGLDVDVVAVDLDQPLLLVDPHEGAADRDLRTVGQGAAQRDQVAVVGALGLHDQAHLGAAFGRHQRRVDVGDLVLHATGEDALERRQFEDLDVVDGDLAAHLDVERLGDLAGDTREELTELLGQRDPGPDVFGDHPALHVDRVGDQFPRQREADRLGHRDTGLLLRLCGGCAQMRRGDDVVEREQRAVGARLGGIDVETGGSDPARHQRLVERFLVDDPAARGVDQHHPGLGLAELFGTDQADRLRGLGEVDGDEVRLRHQRVEVD